MNPTKGVKMSTSKVEELRDRIAVCQATIDQARQHFENHRKLFSDAMQRNFERDLMERQLRLDVQKTQVNRIFPR